MKLFLRYLLSLGFQTGSDMKAKKQIIMRIKLITLLLLIGCLQVSARGYGQQVTLQVRDASLREIFQSIRSQTGYYFVYNLKVMKKARPVDLNVTNVSIDNALDLCFKNQPLTYTILDKTIIVKPKPAQSTPSRADTTLQVQGKVTDEKGTPLPGVSVSIKGTHMGTVTNSTGNYSLTLSDGNSILEFSFVGYNKKEIPVNERTEINVTLQASISSLDQLVVVGYGTQKKSDLTGAISSLSEKDFSKGVASSPDQLIMGKVPGVQVVQNSAEPGGGVSISIRGASSINAGTGPLYVIDGLPIDNGLAVGGGGKEYVNTRSPSNPLSTINPADIKSIEILKDASATAIYGARGANGVIIITTKQGGQGKLNIRYNGYFGVQNVAHKIDLLSPQEYKTVLNALIEDGAAPEENKVGEIINGGTDWQSEIFQKNALIQSHNLSLSGGNDKTTYYVSLNYFDQDGVVKSSSFKRYSARVNLVNHASDKLEFGLNLSTSYSINDYVPIGFGINGEAGSIYTALNFDPTLPAKDSAGNYTVSSFLDMDNPLAEIYGKNALKNSYRTYGTVYGKYFILPSLSFKLNLGGDVLSQRRDVYVSRLTRHGNPQGGIGSIFQGKKTNYLIEGTLTYNKTFGDHHLTALLGATTQRFVTSNTNMGASTFPSDVTRTYNIGLGDQTTYTIGSGKRSNRLLSYLGRINYAFKDKYLFTGSFRIDGSSRFGINNRFGYFPSFAAAWKVSKEKFMSRLPAISNLKLRASWGQTGNQAIGNYAALTTFSAGDKAILDDQLVSTTVPARLPNPDLKWETTAQTDIGLDFGLFNERISGTIDYYNKKTFNMLLLLPVPTSTGYTSKLSNVGSIRNSGWEFSLHTRNLTGPFKWNTSIDLSTLKNKVLSLGSIDQIITGGAGQTSQIFLIQPGVPLYAFYGYKIIGIWQKEDDFSKTTDNVHPGDLKFADVNGDGTVNAEDRVTLGNSFPKLSWSFGNTFSYKNFQLDLFITGSQGAKMLNNNLVDAYFPVQFRRNRFAEPYLNRWTAEHPSNKYPSFISPTGQGAKLVNSYTVEDASYVRLKTLTLRYHFNFQSKVIQDASVYVTGENLLLLTDYSGYDPAVNPNGNVFRRIDFNAYPTARTFMFGLSVNF